jgi:glucose-6-phosphate 1-dehydrogenase
MKDIILFGVTGDLARQKLIPALFNLFISNQIPKDIRFFGFGRKIFPKTEFKDYIALVCNKEGVQKSDITAFCRRWMYIQSELDDINGYFTLGSLITHNAIIYISLPPAFQLPVVKQLANAGVIGKKLHRYVAFEKPYGSDLDSAHILENYLSRVLSQDQIMRVDHYAGKESLLDLEKVAKLGILNEVLNKKVVSKIDVRLHETKTIENRGVFYDSVGALYDIGQNHVLHMLATLLALPLLSDSKEPFSCLRSEILTTISFSNKAVLSQYDSFKSENGISSKSTTETFFALYGKVKKISSMWGGVNIVLSGGKGLKENDVAIYIHFKNKKTPLRIAINAPYYHDAYGHIFISALAHDMNMFTDFKQIETSWKIIQSIKRLPSKVGTYKKGTTPKF